MPKAKSQIVIEEPPQIEENVEENQGLGDMFPPDTDDGPPTIEEELNKVAVDETKPNPWVRDVRGLLPNVDYVFNDEGMVDWRKMLKREHLVPKPAYVNTPVEQLKDNQLLILLPGIKYLARLRGFTKIAYNMVTSENRVIAVCSIDWVENFETGFDKVTFAGVGDASVENCAFEGLFLGPFAENRAFVRCVRNFLNINILGEDEMSKGKPVGDEKKAVEVNQQVAKLAEVMKATNTTFEAIKTVLTKEAKWKDTYESLNDLESPLIFELHTRLNKKLKAKAEVAV